MTLVDAFKSLIPSKFTVYDGSPAVGDTIPEPPWVFLEFPANGVVGRALSGDVHGTQVRGELLVYAQSAVVARLMANEVFSALDGARPVLTGWQFGRVLCDSPVGPARDTRTTYDGKNPFVVGIDFTFTASKIGA